MIGESWIALDDIIVSGGGQNDLWQSLNCKGRYAGEIRIELTYYDTRPRETSHDSRSPSTLMKSLPEPGVERLSGPRQPKPVKRRPLPSEPVTVEQSPTPPGPPQISHAVRLHESSELHTRHSEMLPQEEIDEPYVQTFLQPGSNSISIGQDQYRELDARRAIAQQPPQLGHHELHDHFDLNERAQQHDMSHNHVEAPSLVQRYHPQAAAGHSSENNQPAYEMDAADFIVDNIDPRLYHEPMQQHSASYRSPQNHDEDGQCVVSPISKDGSYNSSLAHQLGHRAAADSWPGDVSPIQDEEDAPPPPPVHAHRTQHYHSQTSLDRFDDKHGPMPTTAPLNFRSSRNSVSNSRSSQVHSTSPQVAYTSSYSQSAFSSNSANASSRPRTQQDQSNQPRSPVREYDDAVPPSLVPGYEPDSVTEQDKRSLHEQNRSKQRYQWESEAPRAEAVENHISSIRAQQLSSYESTPDRRAHRFSAPIVRPAAVSPDMRRPVRKSVSPQPELATPQSNRSGIPFSPDSYDAFNPSIGQASSVNEAGARYETPAQAKEASRQAERKAKLGEGPIIGSDGRIIDPSDHLPTDTWAPEPEMKPPRKGPEITLKFRRSPQGPQSAPPSATTGVRRPLTETRPNAAPLRHQQPMSTDHSPINTHRARLQKKFGLSPPHHPASSPAVPTMNSSPLSRGLMTRDAASDYPAYGGGPNENLAYGGTSPYAGSPGRGGAPLPVPGKIPIDGRYDDRGMSALSDEMSRIDIGVGERPRRGRYGTRDV